MIGDGPSADVILWVIGVISLASIAWFLVAGNKKD